MSRTNLHRGPRIPRDLLDQVQDGGVGTNHRKKSRKDQRKLERQERKAIRFQRQAPRLPRQSLAQNEDPSRRDRANHDTSKELSSSPTGQPTQSLNRQAKSQRSWSPSSEGSPAPVVSRAVQTQLEDDDAEVAALEKKLGIKKKTSKKTGNDEMDWLVYGSGGEDDDDYDRKRKRGDDENWLRQKRQRLSGRLQEDESNPENKSDLPDDSSDDTEISSSYDKLHDEFEGFEEEFSESDSVGDSKTVKKSLPVTVTERQRENPYVAPVAEEDSRPQKYVPPSLRQPAASEEATLQQLRRQLQGQLNRLSETNILSIIQAVQDTYTHNARQHVTSTLVDLLMGLICDPASLNDTFLILHAGFVTALYRMMGAEFEAQLLESIVKAYDDHHGPQDTISKAQRSLPGKQCLNLIAFLCTLYTLNGIGSDIIFEYVRILLCEDDFNESNAELLLRIVRIAGTQLRQDDPTSLKDIVLLLQKTISAIGESNLSVRTKVMIETIHNLKNNRMKTGVAASALAAEHTQRMRKILGGLKSTKTNEPLRLSLADIQNREKQGKWWLVGASWKDNLASGHPGTPKSGEQKHDDASETSSLSDLEQIARAQGMNTDVRRAIFVSVAGAVDYQHAHTRLAKLNLRSKQQLEIPRVLLHCVAAEQEYNHYYTMVATKFCHDHRLRKAWQFALLDILRRLGENGIDTDDEGDESPDDELEVYQLFNMAKMYAMLIAEGLLRMTVLKPIDLLEMQSKTSAFVQVLITTAFSLTRKKERKNGFETAVKERYLQAHAVPDMIGGLKYFLQTVVSKADLAQSKKERVLIRTGCGYAIEALSQTPDDVAAGGSSFSESD